MEEFATLAQATRNAWYYSEGEEAVGPFQMEVLIKLSHAGVIDETTPVRKAEETEWQPLAAVVPTGTPPAPVPVQQEARYYYLDAADQPVGPFDVAALQRLHAEKVVRSDTLVSGVGDPEWLPAARLLKLPGDPTAFSAAHAAAQVLHPRYVPFEEYVKMMGLTLSFYFFYLVPCQSRDLKAITGKERLAFLPLLILGIVTVGLASFVVMVLWAYDLERHGKALNKAGRRESLGTLVLVLSVLCVLANFAIDGFFLAFVVAGLLSGSALWLLQREINLYAVTAPEAIASA